MFGLLLSPYLKFSSCFPSVKIVGLEFSEIDSDFSLTEIKSSVVTIPLSSSVIAFGFSTNKKEFSANF